MASLRSRGCARQDGSSSAMARYPSSAPIPTGRAPGADGVPVRAPLTPAQFDAVGDAMALGEVGVSVVATAADAPHIAHTTIDLMPGNGRRAGQPSPPTRRRARATHAGRPVPHDRIDRDPPAPWWAEDGTEPSNVLPLPAPRPTVRNTTCPNLQTTGTIRRCNSSATWSFWRPPGHPDQGRRAVHGVLRLAAQPPGSTPTAMSRDLLVAETTRRSNMSRLRTWLGSAPDGAPYLPDAYTGRIRLDTRVSSDWERFCALLSGGVNVSSSAALRQALHLVHGTPLGAFGFQWLWAETLRSDMVAMIVDAATVLADRAITHEDLDLALWAVGRGRLAALMTTNWPCGRSTSTRSRAAPPTWTTPFSG
ncbi:hypothetical protein G7085_09110 [Tessaracoccus sp. HDW20]|uniref:hypothetical protein n=1 Tax=Tessaracoccus coleopterorum TaxID=2714950 RepID=UPI0018D3D69A|nr:hypothetical protein [Tessaracoccus coleopterorum]NHB84718.1 hypothetical protein [Tessaracoccus coleopterorum]